MAGRIHSVRTNYANLCIRQFAGVDSRNRIAHIKTKSDKKYLDGGESLIYTIKMFYLYRVVLFHLIGIELSSYNQKIKKSVDKWDDHNGIVDMFLDRLN